MLVSRNREILVKRLCTHHQWLLLVPKLIKRHVNSYASPTRTYSGCTDLSNPSAVRHGLLGEFWLSTAACWYRGKAHSGLASGSCGLRRAFLSACWWMPQGLSACGSLYRASGGRCARSFTGLGPTGGKSLAGYSRDGLSHAAPKNIGGCSAWVYPPRVWRGTRVRV